jgi:hypothetical protein
MRNKLNWLVVPWLILGCSFLVNVIIAGAVNDEPIYTGGVASVYIYMLIMGLLTLNHTYSFALGFSMRRKDYFLGTLITALLSSSLTTIFLSLLSFMENYLNGWGVELYFFHLPYLNDGNIFIQSWVIFMILIHFYYLGFVITSVYRRFGFRGMVIFAIISLLAGSIFSAICTYFSWWSIIFTKIISYTAFQLSWGLGVLSLIYIFIAYLLLRRATV